MIYVYTSINGAYLGNARILAKSVKKFHPEWTFVLLFSDLDLGKINWAEEPFDEVLFSHELSVDNFRSWFFKYNVVELCTAVKGKAAQVLFDERKASKVIYLDPDTVVFSKLDEIVDLLNSNNVLLTPHLTDAESTYDGVWSHEMAALKHGVFNLGFYAFNNSVEARKYVDWWAHRIENYAYADFSKGLFTDQKWANLAPYLFEGVHVIQDKSYNVATWNILNRNVSLSLENEWLINGKPLAFYHFSGFGSNFKWAKQELDRFTKKDDPLRELWKWYEIELNQHLPSKPIEWHWGRFENGTKIEQEFRTYYRINEELHKLFPNPYSDNAFFHFITN